MSITIKKPPYLIAIPDPIDLDHDLDMSCIAHSTSSQNAMVTFSIEDTNSPGNNTSNVKFDDGGSLVDSFSFPQQLNSGDNAVSSIRKLVNNGLAQTVQVNIRVSIKGSVDRDSEIERITVHP